MTSALSVRGVGCRLARKVARRGLKLAEIGGGGGRWGVEGGVWYCSGYGFNPMRIGCHLEGRPSWRVRYLVYPD